MDYDSFPPSGAILRIQDWLESMTKEEPDHVLLTDIVEGCAWPPHIEAAQGIGRQFEQGIEFDVPKPKARRPGENETSSSMMIDPEGLGVLLMYALAGATIRKDSRGDGQYHYMVVAFPSEKTVAVHRLISDAPEDEDAELPHHHDCRRRSLGSFATMNEQRERHGVDRVRLAPRGTRQSTTEMAVRHLHRSEMSRFISEEEYRAMLEFAYLYLDDLPLGSPV